MSMPEALKMRLTDSSRFFICDPSRSTPVHVRQLQHHQPQLAGIARRISCVPSRASFSRERTSTQSLRRSRRPAGVLTVGQLRVSIGPLAWAAISTIATTPSLRLLRIDSFSLYHQLAIPRSSSDCDSISLRCCRIFEIVAHEPRSPLS